MEQAGYINGYRTEINIDRIVRNSLVFVQVHLKQHRAEDFIKFDEAKVAHAFEQFAKDYAITDHILEHIIPHFHFQSDIDRKNTGGIGQRTLCMGKLVIEQFGSLRQCKSQKVLTDQD